MLIIYNIRKACIVSLVIRWSCFIVHVKTMGLEVIGQTRDDAAETDKGCRTLGLGYPGGPKIDKLAKRNPRL